MDRSFWADESGSPFICDFCVGDRAEREFPKMITHLEDLDEETREVYLEDTQDDEMYQMHVFHPY
jgi:hypothetical protein